MSPQTTPKALAALAFTALTSFSSPADAQPEPKQAWSTEGGISLLPGTSGARLEFDHGGGLELPLPGNVEVWSLAATSERWIAAGTQLHDEGRRELTLWSGDTHEASRMPAPSGQRAYLRDQPLLLERDGRLVGMAWLEGETPRALTVLAASWEGDHWGKTERVSFVGPGSQLAPTGAILSDGSWLLAWSAVDGEDDEIVWARRVRGVWSEPRLASTNNHVPDVTPTLAATSGGALLAWSRYDGNDYRVVLARFDCTRFVGEREIGERGSVRPGFVAGPGGPRLLYHTVVPLGWSVVELDGRGRIVQRGLAETTDRDRPLVVPGETGGLALRFAGKTTHRALSPR